MQIFYCHEEGCFLRYFCAHFSGKSQALLMRSLTSVLKKRKGMFDMREFDRSDFGMYGFGKHERNSTIFNEVKNWTTTKMVRRFMEEFNNGFEQLWFYAGDDVGKYTNEYSVSPGESYCCT